jgi:uncharacterized membrane protein YbhN (UPF0104 family)
VLSMRRRIPSGLRLIFGAIGLTFLIIAFRESWQQSRSVVLPSPAHLGTAAALLLLAIVFASLGWIALFGHARGNWGLARAYLASQLVKYVPGGIWQSVGQVGLATDAGIPISKAFFAYSVHMLIQVVAGGSVGATIVLFGPRLPLPLRLAALGGLLPLILLHRGWMSRLLAALGRWTRRELATDLIPAQQGILRSYAWSLATFVANGSAFTLLLSSADGSLALGTGIGTFAIAWTLGFLAVPFPSGVGVREAALIALLGSLLSVPAIIAASIAHRLVSILAELALAAYAGSRRRRSVP